MLIEDADCSHHFGEPEDGDLNGFRGQLESIDSGSRNSLRGMVETGGDNLSLVLERADEEIPCLARRLADPPKDHSDTCGDGGCYPNSVMVAVDPAKSEEAKAAFAALGAFKIERCDSPQRCDFGAPDAATTQAIFYNIQVPGLSEPKVVEQLRRMPMVLWAGRERAPAGAPAEGISLSISRFFSGKPPNDDVALQIIRQAFQTYFKSVSGNSPQLSYRFIRRHPFFYRIEVEGPSRYLAKGQPNAWESIVFEVLITQMFSSRPNDDVMSIFLSAPSSKWAVWPEGKKPHPARLKEYEGNEIGLLQVRLLSELSMLAAPGRRQQAASR